MKGFLFVMLLALGLSNLAGCSSGSSKGTGAGPAPSPQDSGVVPQGKGRIPAGPK